MRIAKFVPFSLLLLGLSPLAHAGIMVEPWVGYESGKLKCTTTGGSDCGGDVTGMNYGARLGYKSMVGLWLAGEYDGSSGLTSKGSNGTADTDIDHTSMGLTVGIDLIFGLRFYGGYNFVEKIKTSSTGSADAEYYGGNSTKFGVGYKLPMLPIAFNLEMMNASYKKLKTNGLTLDVDSQFSTFKGSGFILSVSAPFDF